jgi:hypothetical protein
MFFFLTKSKEYTVYLSYTEVTTSFKKMFDPKLSASGKVDHYCTVSARKKKGGGAGKKKNKEQTHNAHMIPLGGTKTKPNRHK